MRNLWIGTLLVAFVLGAPTAFNAAEEPEVRSIKPLASEAIYLGAMMDDRALEQRTLRRHAQQGGAIDVYNVWPSARRITMNNTLELKGHNYAVCTSDGSIFFGHMIFAFQNSVDVRVVYTFSKAARRTATEVFTINGGGYWLLWNQYDIRDFPVGYYKVKSKYTVTRGGSGSGVEAAFFDVLGC
jgi:hypothetical protein